MISEQRNILLPILERVEHLMRRAGHPGPAELAAGRGEHGTRPPAVPGQTHVDRDDLARIRGELRKQLVAVRGELSKMLSERDCYLALFPIVLCLDEIIQTRYTNVDELSWPLLQREFFGVDRGGELFYDTLEELLGGGASSQLALEVFYFCLSVGFKGRLAGNDERIASYMQRLRSKLEVEVPLGEDTEAGVSAPIRPTGSSWWYYAAAVALLIALYVLLRSLATHEPARVAHAALPAQEAAVQIAELSCCRGAPGGLERC